ncbi:MULTISPECIES: polysaccharide deacetylase family protein [Pseudomonas]|uniref:Polysaccharide deacetylase n=1 Tax=Pseudomonas fluorescens TaxID=294 RepID=A0AAE2A7F6_PSEFL|nr:MULTISPECIES: polysaccharide deacetylase family protein [Pseudomonas]KIF59634.1 polysaccharide deacetylase [Pseudomonas fluorescens]POA36041.1 polysaccharide deacetylase family protein [Pseudomonas sp. GW456-12-1-14-TSB6]TFA83607.1 peptidoglycan/xylan/chitin deacetylase (PgdA/CDA1 family) [Pseudomonas sp. LAIL14HWK12:I2]SCZ24553.1 Peptidoglycan/xylan/chitin deacetylase, PgdA/CDA1 family [Pseudomonas sp. NFIX46]SDB59016.1 Peptidoglycan/xylan/chitin deacetylase, PgdA/CDA1 family [Pseudomonas 
MRIVLFFTAWLLSVGAVAAPGDIATLDRSTWPEKLDNPTLFDVASRAEILMFARGLLGTEALDEAALAQRLGLRTVNLDAINSLRERLWQRLLANYNFAQQSCDQDASFCFLVEDLPTLREQAAKFVVSDESYYTKWAEPSRIFHLQYLDELMRKAALSPQTSSEIDHFGDYERNGDDMHDRLFLLTFDSAANLQPDNTDWLAEYLRKSNLSGTFFMLGKDVQARLADRSVSSLQAAFSQQCVGVQGWEFRSHSHWQDWQDSVRRSADLVRNKLPENYVPLFRPPEGQRRSDARSFFNSQGLQVALWDIDAQDGAGKLKGAPSAQRVLTLMLLWRHGVINFNMKQDAVKTALPWLITQTAQSGIGWEDCQDAFR